MKLEIGDEVTVLPDLPVYVHREGRRKQSARDPELVKLHSRLAGCTGTITERCGCGCGWMKVSFATGKWPLPDEILAKAGASVLAWPE